jgi:hypothetical protein
LLLEARLQHLTVFDQSELRVLARELLIALDVGRDVGPEDVPEVYRALDRFEERLARAQSLQGFVDAFWIDLDGFVLKPDRLVVAELDLRTNGHCGGERDRLEVGYRELWQIDGMNVLLFDDFVIDLGNQLVERFVEQGITAAEMALNHGSRCFAGPKPGDLYALGEASIGGIDRLFDTFGCDLNLDFDLGIGEAFSGDATGPAPSW